MTGLSIIYMADDDIVEIDGVRYQGELFRSLALAAPGTWLRIEERSRGVLSVRHVSDEQERTFDAMIGKKPA